ncbi:MAG: hypothetical protein KGM98_12170, partial [Bacteroidota bacterium]|nr:hypothetical protein [Bacteroidota bacterium]
ISKNAADLDPDEREMYLKLNPYERISREDRKILKYVSHLMEKSPKFTLKEDELSFIFNTTTVHNVDCDTALFSRKLITLCLNKLKDFILDFQLKELPEEGLVSLQIDNYNATHKTQIPKAEMLKFYDCLVKSGSFKEAGTLTRSSRATLYRYKARFKKIGITEKHFLPEENTVMPEAPLNLDRYHSFVMYELKQIRNGHIKNEL